MEPITMSEMTTKSTNSAEVELIRSTGQLLADVFKRITHEDIMIDAREYALDIMDNQESE